MISDQDHLTSDPRAKIAQTYGVTPSVRPSACLSVTSRNTAKTVRDRRGAYTKSSPGYSGDPSLITYDTPFLQTGDSQPPVNTYITNCGQTVPVTAVVRTGSLWEHTIALPKRTTVDP